MKRAAAPPASPRRVLIFVDESNVTSSAKVSNRKLDWIKLRDFLVGERALLEMVVYAGLPPAMTEWQAERDRENKFLHQESVELPMCLARERFGLNRKARAKSMSRATCDE